MSTVGRVERLMCSVALVGLIGGAGPILAQERTPAETSTASSRTTRVVDSLGRVHYRMKKFTLAERKAAARRLEEKLARAGKNRLSARLPIGDYVTKANGELFPDYSGVTPNWANTPPLRKFVSGLPGLCGPGTAGENNLGQCIPVAVAQPSPVAGEGAAVDYYEIELGEYNEQMHLDLPGPYNPTTPGALGTRLRGYRQTNTTDPDASEFHYLGPLIIAQKGKPVRIKFTNNLPAGAGGNLFIPVDASIMGAGAGPNVSDAARTATPPDVLCSTNLASPGEGVPAGCFTHNRATLHLHGGVTPWISDGTTHQWITPAGENAEYPKGVSVYNVPDMENPGKPPVPPALDPGAGVMTFYYTNDQSARLIFYHDHASGITRLNVYAGEAAGYLLQDPTELDLIARNIIPADQFPLVIQDKSFVDAATIGTTDPTWNWGTGAVDPLTGLRQPVTGDLWWPHVYMPAQNPYDLSGLNPMGRWHYGPWFWPPTTGIPWGPVANPYYDCGPGGPCTRPEQYPEVPGAPNPSWGAEAFMDTPIVNGTAYPTLTVQPKAYRFRILDAAHDRFFNLSWFVAADKTTATSFPPDPLLPPVALCNGSVATANCTEVSMINAAPNPAFPELWPTDGRDGGVPDPAAKGPDWIQIGTEGGFLPMPVVIPAQPITWNGDPTTFNAGNVQDHSLLLGPAERADVIVDFSAYAGKTLILYNDAPAAFPALDPHYDYYTGAPDMTDIGGVAPTLPGMGPNTRTIMQVYVSPGAAQPFDTAALNAEFDSTGPGDIGVFQRSQDPIIVGQAAYDPAYFRTVTAPAVETFPTTYPYWGYARIQDNSMSLETVSGGRVTLPLEPKAIQDEMGETFDDYGRMSAKLGLEIPFTQAGNQNFVLQGYADPPTELIRLSDSAVPIGTPMADGTQIWKVTHNGVDTHPVHFHLFHVQLINRVGWDGAIRPPDPNELGWKDTVRISPLEDTIVALRPIAPAPATLPFKLPNSFRPLEPALPIGSTLAFANLDPQGNPVTVTNQVSNFGWEYIWHCHILSHEENDMMRAIVFAATPEAPTVQSIVSSAPPFPASIGLAWADNSLTTTGFRLERATDSTFISNLAQLNLGKVTGYIDDDPALVPGLTYHYRVIALNTVGSAVPGYPTITAESLPAVFPPIVFAPGSVASSLSPRALAFAIQMVGTASAAQTVTLTNLGSTTLTIDSISLTGPHAAEFGLTNTCGASLAPAASCTADVTFTPALAGTRTAGLTISTNDSSNPLQTVALSGTGTTTAVGDVGTDFDGDGRADILWRKGATGESAVWLMNGATTLSGALLTTVPAPWEVADAGDLDGNGMADVLWRNGTSGDNAVWFMNGTSVVSSSLIASVAPGWDLAGAGDFDGDAREDLLWYNPTTGEAAVWLMNGTTIASGAVLGTVGANWVALVGDIDANGKADVSWFDPATGQTAFWVMDGAALVSGALGSPVPAGWAPVGVGDFDGDNKVDLLLRSVATGENGIWFLNGPAVASTASLPTLGAPWAVGGVGDFDGNNMADVIWRDTTTGDNAIWFMNGATVVSGAFTAPVVDTGWTVELP